jgi:TRAP-type C4-dicarboxylate transport system permease small subunit
MKIFDDIDKVLQVLITVLTSVLVTVSFASVFFRFILQHSLVWADEFMRYLFIWVVFFAGSVLAVNRAHITVDLTSLFVPRRYRTFAYRAGYAIVLAFLAILFAYSIKLVVLSVERLSPSMELPMAYVYLCLPIGIGLMIIAYLRLMIRDWNGIPPGREN